MRLLKFVSLITLSFVLNCHADLEKNILNQTMGLSPEVLGLALKANACLNHEKHKKQNLITIIDYSKPSNEKRLWVIDIEKQAVLFETFTSHGMKSGDLYAKAFSNKPGSRQTSIGVFLTGNEYHGKNGLSLQLHGLEPGYNNNAYRRSIVMHGASYVADQFVKKIGRLGRSWGCPTLSRAITKPIIDTIKKGSMLFAYYPDKQWLQSSNVLNCQKVT